MEDLLSLTLPVRALISIPAVGLAVLGRGCWHLVVKPWDATQHGGRGLAWVAAVGWQVQNLPCLRHCQ